MRALRQLKGIFVREAWSKMANPTVSRGKTIWPKTQADLERYGVRLDSDGQVEENRVKYNKIQVQLNAGKIPAALKKLRDKIGTHGVITTFKVKDGTTQEEVEEVVAKAFDEA